MAGKISISSRGTPGGNDKEVQFNDAGNFAGGAQLFWDKATDRLGIGDSTPAQQLSLTKSIELLETTASDIGVIYKGATRFLHNYRDAGTNGCNLFLGLLAGNFSLAGAAHQASYNVGIGYYSLTSITSGYGNMGVGYNTLRYVTDGFFNMGIGTEAGERTTTGDENCAIGRRSLRYNVTGNRNTAIGTEALISVLNNSISNNVAIGYKAGKLLVAGGNNNILVGYQAGDNLTTGEKNVIIGYLNALVAAGDSQLNIGGLIFGDLGAIKKVGIGTSVLTERLNVIGGIRLGTSSGTNAGTIRWTGTDFEGYNSGWKSLTGGALGGANTQVQFNDSGVFGGDSGLVYDKTKNMLSVGVPWGAGYPFDSYEGTIEAVSEKGEWGILGASRSSDSGVTGGMRCLGVYGFVKNDSNNSAYALYTEARKTVSTPGGSTSGAEIVILNRYNSQVDVTPSSNPAQATYGLALTSGVTYDAVQDYDASVGLYLDEVGAKFRRGIVMSSSALRDHGGGKYIGIALPSSARIAWVNDNNCIMGNATEIDTLIGNNVISSVTSTKVTFNKEVVITEGIKIGDGGAAASAGMIRWSGTHFLGYNGSAWVQLDN
jgi:hypothetical protein